jgi:hypothetical protein
LCLPIWRLHTDNVLHVCNNGSGGDDDDDCSDLDDDCSDLGGRCSDADGEGEDDGDGGNSVIPSPTLLSCFHITPAIRHFQIIGIFCRGIGGIINSDGGTLLDIFTILVHRHGKINLIVHLLLLLPRRTVARIPSARAPPLPLQLLPRSSPPRWHIPEQVIGKCVSHNGMHAVLHAERAVVHHPPHNLAPLPAQASEDATGVHPAPAAATVPFGYGAGQGLDLPAQIIGLGLTRGGGGNNGG